MAIIVKDKASKGAAPNPCKKRNPRTDVKVFAKAIEAPAIANKIKAGIKTFLIPIRSAKTPRTGVAKPIGNTKSVITSSISLVETSNTPVKLGNIGATVCPPIIDINVTPMIM